MSNLGILHRLYLLVEKVENGYHPSLQEIYDHYRDHGFEISRRTLQRDLKTLRIEFGIEITYDNNRNGYYLDREGSINVDSFYRFLEYAQSADQLSERIREDKSNLDFIHFESQGTLKGLELLKDLMFAIRNSRIIDFTHYNFLKETRKPYTVKPYGLKEYQNRWYVVGTVDGVDNPLKFGIDRIENLSVRNETFRKDPHFDIHDLFEDVIGLTHTEKPREKIVLHFDPLQGKYIKTLPIHHSQQVVEENEQGIVISIRVQPNFELIQKLMMQCDSVKVLEPQWLADEVQAIHRSALERYKK